MEVARRRVEQVEDDAVGIDQPAGLGDDVAQDLAGLAQDRDPRGDLAQRLLGLGAPAERVARQVELLDQARRPDGDGGLVGDGLEEAAVGAPQASGRIVDTISAPNGPFSSVSGAAITDRIPIDREMACRRSAAGGSACR